MVQNGDKDGKISVTHINIRRSIFFMVLKLVVLDVVVAAVGVFYYLLASNKLTLDLFKNALPLYDLWFIIMLVVIKIALSIYVVMQWINEYYEIWPDAIIYRSGFLLKHEDKHPLQHIRSIKIEQGFMGKTFGYGTVSFYDWYLERETSMYLIHNPIKYFNIIETLTPKAEEEKDIFQEKKENNKGGEAL